MTHKAPLIINKVVKAVKKYKLDCRPPNINVTTKITMAQKGIKTVSRQAEESFLGAKNKNAPSIYFALSNTDLV